MWISSKCAAASFSQPISLQHINPQIVKITTNLRLKARTSRDEIPHAPPERVVNLSKKYAPGIDAKLPQPMIQSHQPTQNTHRKRPPFSGLFEYPFMNQVEELWNHSEHADIPFLQRP